MIDRISSGVISAYKNHRNHIVLSTPGAVAVLPFLDPLSHPNPRVLLIKQHRSAVDHEVIEIVAGLLDVDREDPKLCASRELTEETGYSSDDIHHINTILTSPGISTEKIYLYIATNLQKIAEPEFGITTIELPLNTCLDAIYTGYTGSESGIIINDAKTIIAILSFVQFYKKRFFESPVDNDTDEGVIAQAFGIDLSKDTK